MSRLTLKTEMERERTIIGALFLLQLILWLGFLVHRSPRFPGSFAGGVLAVSGALLVIVPLVFYSAVKRIEFFKRIVIGRFSLSTLLSWHVYTSVAGAILAILHTGHRFESNLGIWLTAMMLLTVLVGFIGRYFLRYEMLELREKQDLLFHLATEYNQIVGDIAGQPDTEIAYAASHGSVRHALNSFLGTDFFIAGTNKEQARRVVRLAESIADLEYAIKTHELLKRRTKHWLWAHIATSAAFYLLLALHVWSGIYYGLRWFG